MPLIAPAVCSQYAQRMISDAFTMTGASYLPWMAGALTEHPGQGYWLSFDQRLLISYEVGDHLFGLLYPGHVVGDEEEDVEDAVEEEVI